MFTVRVEHVVASYDAWKTMFDNDPLDRRESGAKSYRIMRPVDDKGAVMIDLDFDTRAQADAMVVALHRLWEGPAAEMLVDPKAQVAEIVEASVV
ncbi:hypothetical protein AB4Y63_03730 [Leifsonia sp. YAF41]|uniref:hypothetical protein n=1 Tax=Leifsonia sp. YAF41 TaxID=3233086 RepID=UPI003F97AFC5